MSALNKFMTRGLIVGAGALAATLATRFESTSSMPARRAMMSPGAA
jgi:hypothetical protein